MLTVPDVLLESTGTFSALWHSRHPFQLFSFACRLVVNFSQAVVEAVREARYLDRLGFAVPDVALHAALQASRFRAAVEGLSLMLAAYYKVGA